MWKELFWILVKPTTFFTDIDQERFWQPLRFLLFISTILGIGTAWVNYLGWPSTDFSSAFQAQILAWRLTESILLPRFGVVAFFLEYLLIVLLTPIFAVGLAVIIHVLYTILGGHGRFNEAWKAVCYGAAPSVLFGWVPYWSLIVASWSMILQVFYGPKIRYKIPEDRALWILAFFFGATLIEFALSGTTVGFGLK